MTPARSANADWERLDAEMDTETIEFCKNNTDAEELHAFAATWNWDKGIWGLREILQNSACEAATALLVYWLSGPEYYLQYADRQAVEAGFADVEMFDFHAEIEARHIAGEFRIGSIAFDAATPEGNPSGLSLAGLYDDLRDKFVRALPPKMYTSLP